jgi:hypothetical protein
MTLRRYLMCVLWLAIISQARTGTANDDLDFFERKIRPVLVEHCYACHSLESGKSNGGLRVDSREALQRGGESGAAVVQQDVSKSLLVSALKYDSLEMPPKGRLPESIIADFEKWIATGAADPRLESEMGRLEEFESEIDYEAGKKFWAFQPLATSQPLPGPSTPWERGPNDHWISSACARAGLEPNPEAAPEVLLRRLSFDLLGLPPTMEDREAFLRDPSPQACETLVDRWLHSPRFGEHWARPWLDLARYAEDQAHIVGDDRSLCFPNAYRYRDWLIQALNTDTPYDEFVRLQLAADLMYPDREELLPALGFMGLGPKYYRRNAPEVMAEEWEDRVDVLSRGVLGLTVACARCHDHKFDPIGTEDYYALAGVFASSQMFNRPLKPDVEVGKDGQSKSPDDGLHILREATPTDLSVMIRGDVQRRGPVVPRRFIKVLSPAEPPRFQEGSGRLELARTLTAPGNPLFARVMVNRVWQALFGKGLVATPSNFGAMGQTPSHPELLDDLSNRFIQHGWSIKWLIREIVLSSTYRQSSQHRSDGQNLDPENRLLWRMNRKRLSVEAWRDAILVAADRLDGSLGGKSIDPSLPDSNRRTLYSEVSRLSLNRMLAVFDFPDPNAHSDGRVRTVNPLQKLFILNSPFMLAQAQSLAKRQEGWATHPEDRIRATYFVLLARAPSQSELTDSLEYVQGGPERWTHWAQILLSTTEFSMID